MGRRLLHDARGRGRPDRRRRERQPRVRHRLHVPPAIRRRRCDAARKVPTSSATRSGTTTCSVATSPAPPTSGPTTGNGGPARATTPTRSRSRPQNQDRLGAKVVRGRHQRAARRDGLARPGARVLPPLRGLWRRHVDPVVGRGPQPPRAHHGELRADRTRGAAGVRRARREAAAREGTASRTGDRSGAGPQARIRSSAARPRLRDPGATRARAPTTASPTSSTAGSTTTATRSFAARTSRSALRNRAG